jgi:type I restriction enzyme S subunit
MSTEEKTKLVPNLRFPEFRGAEGWTSAALVNACNLQAGKFVAASNISERNQKGFFPCFGGNGLRGYTETYTHNGTYPLIGRQGALCGNVRLANEQFHATEHAVVATPKTGIDVGWLYYSLDLLNLNRFATGQAQPGLSIDVLENVALAISPLVAEQKKIADCLSSVDELIASQGRKVEALKTHKKGLMQQLFPREGETQPRLRFPEFVGDWEIKTLKQACKMQAGKFISAPEIKDKNSDGFFPCFGGNGLRGYTETHTHEGTYPLIGRQGALCGNVKLAKSQFYATEHALVAAPNAGVHTVWLYYLLDFMNLNQYATGQAQPGLSVDVLNALPVVIPMQEKEQQRIADSLSSVDDLIDATTQELDTLKTHKKGLMQQLFPSLEIQE